MAPRQQPLPPDTTPPPTALVTQPVANVALATRARETAGTGQGTENLDTADLVLPRLALVQRTSDEIDATTDKYIPGATFTQMFNSLTRELYGNGPIRILSLGLPRKRAIQFDENKKVVDRDVPLAVDPNTLEYVDARMRFTKNAEGKDVKPQATLFYEFPVLIVSDGRRDLAVMSMKGTQIKAAKDLISVINYRGGAASGKDVWDGAYTVTSVKKDFPKGPAAHFVVVPSGASTDAEAEIAKTLFAMLQTKNVRVDDDGLDGDEGQADEKVPF